MVGEMSTGAIFIGVIKVRILTHPNLPGIGEWTSGIGEDLETIDGYMPGCDVNGYTLHIITAIFRSSSIVHIPALVNCEDTATCAVGYLHLRPCKSHDKNVAMTFRAPE